MTRRRVKGDGFMNGELTNDRSVDDRFMSDESANDGGDPGGMHRKVVFDIDDVAWNLGGRVASLVGVDYNDLIEFRVMENERLALETREAINRIFGEARVFEGIEFYPGFEMVGRLADDGVMMQFRSNSFSEEVRDIKLIQIKALLPWICDEQIDFRIVNEKTTHRKSFDDDTYIVVDDSPYNIAKAPCRYAIMPICPWNQTERARRMVADKDVRYVPAGNFEKILGTVRELL